MPKRSRDYVQGLIEDLNDPVMAADYVNAAQEDSLEMFLLALRDVAATHRMANVAVQAGLSRESLYRTLSAEGNPRLESLMGILTALGLRMRIEVADGVTAPDYTEVFVGEQTVNVDEEQPTIVATGNPKAV